MLSKHLNAKRELKTTQQVLHHWHSALMRRVKTRMIFIKHLEMKAMLRQAIAAFKYNSTSAHKLQLITQTTNRRLSKMAFR